MDFDVKDAIDRIVKLSTPNLAPLADQANKMPVMTVPEGMRVESLKKLIDEYATKPDRRIGTDKLQDIESLIAWTNRHKDAGTVVFCDTTRTAPKLLTVVDYHHKVPAAVGEDATEPMSGDDTARFAKFRALYEFPLSEQWKAWRAVDGKTMDQGDFAEFLENRVLDLIAPDIGMDGQGTETRKLPQQVAELLGRLGGTCAMPSDIITLAKGLDVTANARTVQRVDVNTGEGALMFEETHAGSGGQKIAVPKLFLICIPLFDKATVHYRIPVRIRYRLSGGIKWTFTLFGADDVTDEAILEAAKTVQAGTGRPLFYGVPG